jgi:peroxiredoxin Q/BCP
MKSFSLLKSLLVLAALLAFAFTSPANPENFTLQSATSKATFKLSDARGKFVVIHFLLKTECPYCLRHTHDYFAKGPSLTNVVQVFVKPDTDEEIKKWSAKLPSSQLEKNPIYRDPEAKLAKDFSIPDGYHFHGQIVHFPALVLLGLDGKEVFRYVGKSNSDRLSFDKLAEKVAELTKK